MSSYNEGGCILCVAWGVIVQMAMGETATGAARHSGMV